MKTTSKFLAGGLGLTLVIILMLAAVLVACGGSSGSSSVKVDELSAGVYTVSTGDENAPTIGRYYAAPDGRRLLVLEGEGEAVLQVLQRTGATTAWAAVPVPAANTTVSILRSEPRASSTPDIGALFGHYVVNLGDGKAADLDIAPDGRLVAGTLSACRLSGTLAAGSFPGTLAVTLSAQACAGLPASSAGVLVADAHDAPARFRLVAENGAKLVDLRGYAE